MNNWFAKAFNTSILEKNRMAWVDYLRGIAILLVVYRHVLLGLESSHLDIPPSLMTANMIFFSFRMPLFFIISGIFINGSISRRPLNKLAYTKFENLFYPYLVWSFIQITVQLAMSGYTNTQRSFKDYSYILYQPRALDQFWYLPALFNATMIYLLVKVKLKAPQWSQLLLGLGLYFLAPHVNRFSMLSDWMEFYIFFALGDAISSFFFHQRSQSFLTKPVTLLASIPFFALAQLYYLHFDGNVSPIAFLVIAIIGCFTMFALAFRLQAWNILRFLRVLGFHSLFIYVMHVLVAAFVRAILMRYAGIHDPVILLACGIITGVIVPVVAYNLLIKDNILWFLFYLKRPEKYKKTPAVT